MLRKLFLFKGAAMTVVDLSTIASVPTRGLIPGIADGGECATTPDYPKDALLMEGHYGQVVAMIPSKDAVIVRLGWSVDADFDGCEFVADVTKTLPAG